MRPHVTYQWRGKLVVLRALVRKLRALGIPGASSGNLSRVFSGQQPTNVELVRAIAKAEGITMEEVLEMLDDTARQHREHRNQPLFGEEDEAAGSE